MNQYGERGQQTADADYCKRHEDPSQEEGGRIPSGEMWAAWVPCAFRSRRPIGQNPGWDCPIRRQRPGSAVHRPVFLRASN
jgi:hypothetical protein